MPTFEKPNAWGDTSDHQVQLRKAYADLGKAQMALQRAKSPDTRRSAVIRIQKAEHNIARLRAKGFF